MTKDELMQEEIDKLMERLKQVQAYEKLIKEVLRIKVNDNKKYGA
jgi:hypothetical protein